MNAADVSDVLREVVDPELAIDVVSLGLIYAIAASDDRVEVEMTTTTRDCPVGGTLLDQASTLLGLAYPAAAVAVRLVERPAWEVGMVDAAGRRALGFPG